MPWEIVEKHPQCNADAPWGVVKKGEGKQGKPLGCHATEDDARAQQAALYAQVEHRGE